MRALAWILSTATLAWALWAPPAAALLGGDPYHVAHSPLMQGASYFRYEGRVGSRYYFGGATYCAFGNGLMAFDVINGKVVQQTLVLPVPNSVGEERRI